MILVPCRFGALGNQLFHIAHFMASALHGKDIRFHFASFQYPLKLFPHINSHPLISVATASARTNRLYAGLFRLGSSLLSASSFHAFYVSHGPPHVNTGSDSFLQKSRRRLIVCNGFGFRDPDNVRRYSSDLRHLLSLAPSITQRADLFARPLRDQTNPLIVGFHIRRGDYRTYESGRFFLSNEDWLLVFSSVRNQVLRSGRTFKGILFSNEDVSPFLGGNSDLVLAPGLVYEDLALMSQCDYLVGPPSTFSGWASFVGSVPFSTVQPGSISPDIFSSMPVDW